MNFELSGTVNFSESEEIKDSSFSGRYQFVYASQLYGTFFSIFAKFESQTDKEAQTCKVTGAEFILLNYKGVINLGIDSIDEIAYNEYDVPSYSGQVNLQCLNFRINIMALKESFIPIPKLNLDIDIDLKKENYLRIDRNLMPMSVTNPNTKTPEAPKFNDIAFDSEFYNRSGVFYNPRDTVKMNGSNNSVINREVISPKGPWGSCPPGYNKIVFGN